MATPVTNFGKVTVSIGYDAAATSIVLTTGHGSRLPSTFPYPLAWWNATDYSDPADDPSREIVIVTNRAGDTLTVTRAGEGTSASTKNTGGKTYKMVLGLTKAMWDAIHTRSLSQDFRGVIVRTHPDSDKGVSQVRFSADALVMDDGEEVQGWTNIDVALTASGVNGIDTGSEAASVGYELWAIYNGTTKAGVLHRAKDYFLDETWDQSGGTTEDGQHLLRDATARTKLAQGFKVDTAGLLELVDVKIAKIGTPTGNIWFTIEATSGGVPSNTPLATSDKYDVSRLTTTSAFLRFPFRTPATLSAATQYHLVLQGDFTVSGANHVLWRADVSAATYANGSKAAYDGATWTSDTDDDFLFKIYITRNDVAVSLPAGYTQKALLCPWAYNNGSSNLAPFSQLDHAMYFGQGTDALVGTIATSTAVATLVSLAAFIPCRPVRAWLAAKGTGPLDVGLGQLKSTDLVQTVGTNYGQTTRAYLAGGTTETIPYAAPILLEYQGVLSMQSGSIDLFLEALTW